MAGSRRRQSLKPKPGTYAVVLRCEQDARVIVGRLGALTVRRGHYVYVGSAFGPGGVAARVRRHWRTGKPLRWHLDYLRESSLLVEAWHTYDPERREHHWVEAMVAMRLVPWIDGFGSSDCGCYSHLFRAESRPGLPAFRELVSRTFTDHEPIHLWAPPIRQLCGNPLHRTSVLL